MGYRVKWRDDGMKRSDSILNCADLLIPSGDLFPNSQG